MNSFVVVDVETTGSLPGKDRIIEIGAAKVFDNKIVDTFKTLINPNRQIPRIITEITGITNQMVARAPSFLAVADKFKEFIGKSVFAAHNATFDYNFVNMEFAMASIGHMQNPMICTLKLARQTFPGFIYYNLPDLCRNLKISHPRAHRAGDDAFATAQLLIKILKRRTAMSEPELIPQISR